MIGMIHPWLLLISLSIPALKSPYANAEDIDLVVSADYVVTMDDKNTVINKGAVAIDDGIIVAVDEQASINGKFSPAKRIAGENQVLMPGLVNGHTHAAMVLFRGIADDLELMEWLTKYIFPAEIRFVNEEFVRTGTQLACLEMIRGGTTTIVDMYFHPKEIARVMEECGLRAVIGAAVIEQESGYTKNFADAMNKAESFIEQWKNRNNRITPAFAPHAAYTITPDNLNIVRKRADELSVGIAIHLSESKAELKLVGDSYGETSINHLEKIGFFHGPTIAAHVVWPTAAEIAILSARGVGAIHNPTSNMKIASGFAPVPEMLDAGVAVGLGTDGAASNNDLDMWDEIRLAAYIHKGRLLDPETMPAMRVLEIATRVGAAAIGLSDTGSLATGKHADLILVSLEAAHLVPMYDVVSHLVYAVDAQDVQTVIVDGKVLMEDRKVLTLDEREVIKAARTIAARIDKEIRATR